MTELKVIPNTHYAINSNGDLFNMDKDPIFQRKAMRSPKGYKQYCIKDLDNRPVCIQAHRLVAELFLPNPDNLPQVNHIDEDRFNSCVGNLEWCSGEYNVEYSQAKTYILTHKDGSQVEAFNLSKFARSIGKTGAGNFHKLLNGEIKSCYGYISIVEKRNG